MEPPVHPPQEKRDLLRHFLATLAYRTRKAVTGAPSGFPHFYIGSSVRTPLDVLAHMRRLLWSTRGYFVREPGPPPREPSDLPWEQAVTDFFDRLVALDRVVEGMPLRGRTSRGPLTLERLLQGPVSDALTHAGQLAMLRRLAGAPLPGEDFTEADIRVGAVRPPDGDAPTS